MSEFTESLHKFRVAEEPIEVLLDDIERIVVDDKENPVLLLAELSQENTKHPLSANELKSIKSCIVTLTKLENTDQLDRIELDDTVEINQRDETEELDDIDYFDDASGSEAEHIIGTLAASHSEQEIAKTQVNKDSSAVDAELERQKGIDRNKLVGHVLNDRYRLDKYLGSGGMGTVYRALDLNRQNSDIGTPYVAIKIFVPNAAPTSDLLQNLRKEIKRLQQFSHAHIVEIYDIDLEDHMAYLVMEYLPGKTLRDMIRAAEFEGLPLQEALPIIRAMGGALSFAHDQGIVHYDFKPGNVIITDIGQIKVIDFGIARAYTEAESEKVSIPNSTILTPVYASAEMLERQPPDPRDDIYALGCTVYELLTGHHPFNQKRATQARDSALQPQCPKGLEPVAWEALKKTLAFDRRDRTPNVWSFLKSLHIPEPSKTAIFSVLNVVAAIVIVIMAVSSYLIVADDKNEGQFESQLTPSIDTVGNAEKDAGWSDLFR